MYAIRNTRFRLKVEPGCTLSIDIPELNMRGVCIGHVTSWRMEDGSQDGNRSFVSNDESLKRHVARVVMENPARPLDMVVTSGELLLNEGRLELANCDIIICWRPVK